jgi:hypothetical protein
MWLASSSPRYAAPVHIAVANFGRSGKKSGFCELVLIVSSSIVISVSEVDLMVRKAA